MREQNKAHKLERDEKQELGSCMYGHAYHWAQVTDKDQARL